MRRNRLQDDILIIVILIISAGVYGLFFLLGLPSLGTVFFVVSVIVLCFLSCYLPAKWKKKKIEKLIAENPPDKAVLTPEEFKYCMRCNAAVDKNLKTCPNCGQPFEI